MSPDLRILWVEDDALYLQDMVYPLRKMGIIVDIVLDYSSALNQLTCGKPYDLVLLDIIIPSGIKTSSMIDNNSHLENTKFGLKLLEDISKDKNIKVIVFSVISKKELGDKIKEYSNVKEIITKGSIRPLLLKDKVMKIISEKG